MGLDDMHAQHQFWSAQDHPPELALQTKLWMLGIIVGASFLCIGYVFYAVIEKERKEQKNK
jgi:hypothetical protein